MYEKIQKLDIEIFQDMTVNN